MTDEKVPSQGDDLDLQVGDIVRIVVQDEGDEGDMVAFIDGTICFIKDPADDLSFGDTARVKIADIGESQIRAVRAAGD